MWMGAATGDSSKDVGSASESDASESSSSLSSPEESVSAASGCQRSSSGHQCPPRLTTFDGTALAFHEIEKIDMHPLFSIGNAPQQRAHT